MCENKQIVKCKKCETYHIFDFQTREVVDNVGKIIRMRAVSAASSILPGKHGLICFLSTSTRTFQVRLLHENLQNCSSFCYLSKSKCTFDASLQNISTEHHHIKMDIGWGGLPFIYPSNLAMKYLHHTKVTFNKRYKMLL